MLHPHQLRHTTRHSSSSSSWKEAMMTAVLMALVMIACDAGQAYAYPPFVTNVNPTSGPKAGGTVLNIYGFFLGQNENDVASVLVVEEPCGDVTWMSSTYITCVTGPKSESKRGNVTVTTYSGGEGSGNATYTYNLEPYIDRINPNNGPAMGGTMITLFGNSLGTGQSDILYVRVGETECTNIKYISSSSISCVTGPSNAGSYYVSMENLSGGKYVGEDEDVRFTYNTAPRVTKIDPDNGPSVGGILVHIFGDSLGKLLTDVVDVVIAGNSCHSTLKYYNSTYLACTLPEDESLSHDPGNRCNDTTGQSGPVVVTTTSGGSGLNSINTCFTYNHVPVVRSVLPASGPASGGTTILIQGQYLGSSKSDIIDVTIAGHSCKFSVRWLSSTQISCITPRAAHGIIGDIVVSTISGGSSTSTVTYTYNPVCFVYSSEMGCHDEGCHWCDMTTRCVSDAESCPSYCTYGTAQLTCGMLTIIILLISILVTCMVGVATIIYFININKDFKESMREKYFFKTTQRDKVSVQYPPSADAMSSGGSYEQFPGSNNHVRLPARSSGSTRK